MHVAAIVVLSTYRFAIVRESSIPLTADEVKIHTPPDWVARIGRLIGADGEVTFFHRLS